MLPFVCIVALTLKLITAVMDEFRKVAVHIYQHLINVYWEVGVQGDFHSYALLVHSTHTPQVKKCSRTCEADIFPCFNVGFTSGNGEFGF